MKAQSIVLQHTLDQLLHQIEKISDEEFDRKPHPHKWSKKEVLGHLIDSAQNNIQRFIRSQYQPETEILYNQDEWVRFNNYQQSDRQHLIRLWTSLNQQLMFIWNSMSPANLQKQTGMGNDKRVSLAWLMDDYVAHLQHHAHQLMRQD